MLADIDQPTCCLRGVPTSGLPHEGQEGVSAEAGAPHEAAVNLITFHEATEVLGCHAAAVLDAYGVGRRLVRKVCDHAAHVADDTACIVGRGRAASPDRPDRLVSDHDAA